jgi:uncharacterized protein (TIGR00251 family)
VIRDHPDGCILSVRAQPGARRNAVVGPHGAALKVAVTAPPDKGKANDAILSVLADALALRKADLEVIAGHASRDKKILVRGLSAAGLRERF